MILKLKNICTNIYLNTYSILIQSSRVYIQITGKSPQKNAMFAMWTHPSILASSRRYKKEIFPQFVECRFTIGQKRIKKEENKKTYENYA